ncbi:MAG: hypothetical protein J6Q59_08550, partial [Paludibacteraceae bacterium]|nr:hypothetical protein [Paludibacteraceae bacterium]
QMAESVDALVSNTSGFTSIPVRPRVWVRKKELTLVGSFFCVFYFDMNFILHILRRFWIIVLIM